MTACAPTVAAEIARERRIRQTRHQRLRPPLVPVRLVRQRDDRREVRELGRELAEAAVDLGRVEVAGREVAEEVRAHRRQAAAEPRVHVGFDERAVARADADLRRRRRRRACSTSPTFTRMRCSMYVSGVVSGSMFTFIVRGPWSIGVPAPRVPRDARATRRWSRSRACRPSPRRRGSGPRSSRSSRRGGRRCRRAAPPRRSLAASAAASAVSSAFTSACQSLARCAPRCRTLDRRAELVAGGLERVELVLVAEDGDGDRPVRVRAQVVVVEVDAVRRRRRAAARSPRPCRAD